MSLLDASQQYEPVTVFPEELVTDSDGNPHTQPSNSGIDTIARFQVLNQTGTSARRSEQDNEGFESEEVYSMRFTRKFSATQGMLGPQSEIEWNGRRWAVFGFGNHYHGSPRTAHQTYTIKRY